MRIDGIMVKCGEELFLDDIAQKSAAPARTIALSDLLEEYLLKLGHSSDHVLSIVLRLMTHGKVRVEFRHCRDRLELVDKSNIRSRAQAIQLFDEFLAHMRQETTEPGFSNMTQRIVVQPPHKKQ